VISVFQAVVIGLIQGITELFPISSLGHSVIVPRLFGWNLNRDAPYYLTFLVATHAATAIVLLLFFWKDWLEVAKGLARSLAARNIEAGDTYAKLGWLLVVGTVPAGILGLLLEQTLRKAFASAQIAAGFLVLNGAILFTAERLRKRRESEQRTAKQSDNQLARLKWSHAIGIGMAQSAALMPGVSRSGSSMAGGLLAGLNNEDAARFSFLLATPIIGAAALLKLPSLFTSSMAPMRSAVLVGALCAAITAALSIKFLLKYFQTRNLTPFAIYCAVAGIIFSVYFLVK
jgi:undecaprenyl-diphosphatase